MFTTERTVNTERRRTMGIELYKDGDNMAIATDAKSEVAFLDDMAELFSHMIEAKEYEGDWCFQFSHWLPQIVDLCCKYRGYKSPVHETRVLVAGWPGVNGQMPVAKSGRVGVGADRHMREDYEYDENGRIIIPEIVEKVTKR
jgi:hypothetical protein